MNCVRCGLPELRHLRADGACIDRPECKGYLASWGAQDVADFAAQKAATKPEPATQTSTAPIDVHHEDK